MGQRPTARAHAVGVYEVAHQRLTASLLKAIPRRRPRNRPPKKEAHRPKVVQLNLKVPLGQIVAGYDASQAKGGRLTIARVARKAQVHLTPE